MKKLIKSILPNWFKKFLAELLRPFGEPPTSIRNLLHFKGNFKLKIDGKKVLFTYTNRWIENDLFWKGIGGYEHFSIKIWIEAAKKANTIFDIGANSGLFSLVAKTVNPGALVYGFEPLPEFNHIFSRNAKMNGYDIHIDDHALSNYSGNSTFYIPQQYQGNIYSSSLSKEHYLNHQSSTPLEIDVKVITLDEFLSGKKIEKIDLVKIDAEGHDVQVLEGMQNVIGKYKPDFLVEVHNDEIGKKIMELLTPDNYKYFNINEVTGIKEVPVIGKSETLNFFICKHTTVLST